MPVVTAGIESKTIALRLTIANSRPIEERGLAPNETNTAVCWRAANRPGRGPVVPGGDRAQASPGQRARAGPDVRFARTRERTPSA